MGKQIDLATFSGELNPRPREFPAMSNSALIFTQFAYHKLHTAQCIFFLSVRASHFANKYTQKFSTAICCRLPFSVSFYCFCRFGFCFGCILYIFHIHFFFTFRLHKFNGTPGWGSAFGVRWVYGYIRYYIPTKLLLTVLIRKAHEMPVRLRMRHFFFAQLHR